MQKITECKEKVKILLGTSETLRHHSTLVPDLPPRAGTAASACAV